MALELDKEVLAGDAMILRGWKTTQEFDVFNKYLECMGDDITGRLMNFNPQTPSREDDYHKGILAGLRMAQQVTENVSLWAKKAAEGGALLKLK